MDVVGRVKENHTVLSVWIDVFNEKNNKQTGVLAPFGRLRRAENVR